MRKQLRAAILFFVTIITFAVPLLSGEGGAAFKEPEQITAYADGAYDNLAVDLAGATAFDDAWNASKKSDEKDDDDKTDYDKLKDNLKTLTNPNGNGEYFGNVGIFIGPKGTSQNSDTWSVFRSKVSLSNDQIEVFDDPEVTNGAFSKYKAFGGAIQKLNESALKTKGSSGSMDEMLDTLTAAGMKISNMGTKIIKDYNPGPVLLAFLNSEELDKGSNADNKFVKMINNTGDLRELVKFFGDPVMVGSVKVSMAFLIMAVICLLLLACAALMTIINGRSSGEFTRKILVKIVVAGIGLPIIANLLTSGVNLLDALQDAQINGPTEQYVRQNLDLADWYACGFSLPSGTTIKIKDNGSFDLSPDNVEEINKHAYSQVWGVENPSAEQIKDKMEEYYNQHKNYPMIVSFSEPLKKSGKPWSTTKFYQVLNNFGENIELATDTDEGNTDEGDSSVDDVEYVFNDLSDKYKGIGYFACNGLKMSNATEDGYSYLVSAGTNPKVSGISPIAATNLMRTSFTGNSMTPSYSEYMGCVAFDIDNGTSTTGDANMPSICRFLMTITMAIAAVKGLFTVFIGGVGALITGAGKTSLGSSEGLGQMVGGVIALVVGTAGIGVIMTMSYGLLDELYVLMQELIGPTFDTQASSILDPIVDAVHDIKIIGPLLSPLLKTVSKAVLSILCMITFPKFGGIPITLFCQHLAELPHSFAAKAQAIENKFTGDFRAGKTGFGGGGGGMGGASSMINAATNAGSAQAKGVAAGAASIAGALGGLALSKAGEKKANEADAKENALNQSMNDGSDTDGTNTENINPGSTDEEQAAAMAAATEDESVNSPETDNEESSASETSTSENNNGGGNNSNDTSFGKMGDNISVSEGGNTENTPMEEKTEMSESLNTDSSYSESDSDSETMGSDIDSSQIQQNSEASVSDSNIESDQTNDNQTMSQEKSNSDMKSEQAITSDSRSTATASSMNTKSVEKPGTGGKSMTNASRSGSTASGTGTTGRSSNLGNSGKASSLSGGKSMTSGRMSTSTSGGKSTSTDKKPLTKEQKAIQRQRAIGNAMMAAGKHTTKGQATAGVIAGAAHMAGSFAGVGNVTQNGVNAVRNYKQRQNDIRDNLGAGYSNNQAQPVETKDNRNQTVTNNTTVNQTFDRNERENEITEYMARQEAEDAVRNPRD